MRLSAGFRLDKAAAEVEFAAVVIGGEVGNFGESDGAKCK